MPPQTLRRSFERNLKGVFMCTWSSIALFPFDHQICPIELVSVQRRIDFDGSLGLRYYNLDKNYFTASNITLEYRERSDGNYTKVLFNFCLRRNPFGYYLRLIVPAILLNLIGFMAFWIDDATESSTLGITTLLCTLALRETVDLPTVSDVTWVELFMLINISFQGVVLLLSFVDYSQSASAQWAKCYLAVCRCWRRLRMRCGNCCHWLNGRCGNCWHWLNGRTGPWSGRLGVRAPMARTAEKKWSAQESSAARVKKKHHMHHIILAVQREQDAAAGVHPICAARLEKKSR